MSSRPPLAALQPARTRSIIFDVPSSLRRTPGPQHREEAEENAQVKTSKPTSLRRCLLSNQKLPAELLVRFELVRPPSSTSSSPLLLTPSGILHPRFDAHHRARGKGMWVKCWKEAVEALAKRGSYKRVHSAAHLEGSSAAARVYSQLARRVVQEAEMFAERAKSWPNSGDGELSACPILAVAGSELEAELAALEGKEGGREVIAILDFSPSSSDPSPPQPFSSLHSLDSTRQIPRYHLPTFFSSVILPPSTLPPLSSSPAESDSPTPPLPLPSAGDVLLSSACSHFDRLIDLWARRAKRSDPSSSPSPPSTASGNNLYLLLGPPASPAPSTPPTSEALLRARQTNDIAPLLLALKRCGLWVGEGWEKTEAGAQKIETGRGRRS